MLKKSIALCLLSSALLTGLAFSQEYMLATSVPNQFESQDKVTEVMQEAPASTPAPATPVQLDRSGIDRASVHLQILQQTNLRLTDTSQPTPPASSAPASQVQKTAADDKKPQAKSSSNS